jgi:hypothetical protein
MVGKAKECFQASGSTESFEAAGREFVKAKDWEKFRTETHSPWLMFQNGYEKYAGLRDETAKAPELERQRAEEWKQASERAREAHMKFWGQTDEPKPESEAPLEFGFAKAGAPELTRELTDAECDELFGVDKL